MGSTANSSRVVGEVTGWGAGARAKGEFRCVECGYGISVHRELPTCPMCHSTQWQRVAWRPYSRAFARRDAS